MPESDEVRRVPEAEWERLKRDSRRRAQEREEADRHAAPRDREHREGTQES
ncbi:hypothetical protein GCM10017714_33070 [Curtobacterium pusillum]|uniref:Uncharacterized protein n=1 Tax=Curtobacterium pusillum TaxID=69373 RepID=A0ABX2MBJ2_9MICO|nr:hypothetical protein [Curtobacterium pusillum]NUU14793.1 hypothetical protein [Curtobacterium pusillum]GLK31659.1 hypothetical protein GCM10017610_19440 [Curtobacterium pusillum]